MLYNKRGEHAAMLKSRKERESEVIAELRDVLHKSTYISSEYFLQEEKENL